VVLSVNILIVSIAIIIIAIINGAGILSLKRKRGNATGE